MKTLISTLVTAATFAAMTSAMAESYGFRQVATTPVNGFHPSTVRQPPLAGLREINQRLQEQRARIERGFHRGAITRWEHRRLMSEQQDIQTKVRAFVADGFLNPRERADLNRRLDIASQHIVFEARDRERRS